jgi:hypothetical protein
MWAISCHSNSIGMHPPRFAVPGLKLLNSFQSAYTKFHSTETALLAVHDQLIRANSQQQVSCLCLLDLSAAFDTIDHSILLERLSSWFGISGMRHTPPYPIKTAGRLIIIKINNNNNKNECDQRDRD